MGFGCNAAGVVGCRIIDSPRERMIAVLTNSFVPCNGRFPAMIAVISMFFVSGISSQLQSVTAALILLAIVVWGVMMTFLFSRLLSKTILKGEPSSFALELPPYRRPQFISVIIRSIFDRTLFVLLRAILIAAPAGLLIWCLANINFYEQTLIAYLTTFLDPVAQIIGLDGVILLAFILGFPANEIVIPLMLMIYLSGNNLISIEDLSVLKTLLVDNGWTWVTAICFLLFSLMHWPCSTTCLTIKKETGSWKWVGWAILLPFLSGFLCCFLFAQSMRLLGLA